MKMLAQAFGLFAANIVVLILWMLVSNINSHKATGLGALAYQGVMLMWVGGFFMVFGFVIAFAVRLLSNAQ